MIIPKKLPDVGDFVIIKITKILPHGAYARLTEYGMDAYLPISEVSSGWIKNIHEFIKEGQQDVAKVIFVDRERGSIDISLKKATAKNKKDKTDDYGLEKRAEGLFNKALESSSSQTKKQQIIEELAKVEHTYNELIEDIFAKKDPLKDLKETQFKDVLYELVAKTIKPKTYTVAYNVELTTTDTQSGIELIKDAFSKIEAQKVEVLYLGAPRYRLISTDESFPKAEGKIKEAQAILEKYKNIEFSIKESKSVE
ncbi:MAG: S1 RNA-binding domain-containing protein [Candidatus Marsarchaeota archaeon]|nr:S1 RNA-binding domain-containing protein [Candidatus Marsarchaeota archaeon]